MTRSPSSSIAKSAMARDTPRVSLISSASSLDSLIGSYRRRSARSALDHREKGEHAVAGRALGLHPRGRPIDRGRARDVAVDPAGIADELAEEEGGGDRPAVPVAGLLHVCDVALDLLA